MVIKMLKKSEARTMVEEYNTQVLKEKIDNAISICDNEISKEIERVAKCGHFSVKVSIPTNADIDVVVNYLNENGYLTTVLTHSYILIEW